MKIIRVTRDYEIATDFFNLFPIYDVHLGSSACDEKLFEKDIARIAKDPTALVILGGDMIDSISRSDAKRISQPGLAKWCRGEEDVIGTQIDRFVKMIAPISSQIIAILEGNHEYAPQKWEHREVYRDLCAKIAALDDRRVSELALGVEGFITLDFGQHSAGSKARNHKLPIHIYARHGYGGGRKKGGKINNLEDMLYTYSCDLGLTGHVHDKLYTSIVQIIPKFHGVVERVSQGVVCGTYLRPYAEQYGEMPNNTYGQRGGYRPSPLGCVGPITIIPSRREVVVPFSNVGGFV